MTYDDLDPDFATLAAEAGRLEARVVRVEAPVREVLTLGGVAVLTGGR